MLVIISIINIIYVLHIIRTANKQKMLVQRIFIIPRYIQTQKPFIMPRYIFEIEIIPLGILCISDSQKTAAKNMYIDTIRNERVMYSV